MKVVICRVGNEFYAIDIQYVVSIERMGHIRSIPETPNYYKGLTELRNEVIPILDFRLWLGVEAKTNSIIEERIIIIEKDHKKIGLIVDAATDVVDIDKQAAQSIDNTKAITHVIKFRDKLILLFDVALGIQQL